MKLLDWESHFYLHNSQQQRCPLIRKQQGHSKNMRKLLIGRRVIQRKKIEIQGFTKRSDLHKFHEERPHDPNSETSSLLINIHWVRLLLDNTLVLTASFI
ncbi:hypothetical protein PIB30_014182 [Stylosanthes scabra]|uniref:Uncharacterized protein n=1 Tax=Stylosanthes scabra TaxID=79078 RepID=A0ABU6V6Y6_9FABA|nr:hypothetical protein [Stylosanthes scabra]